MKRLITLIIALILMAGSSWAQVSLYTFASSTGTYTALSTETVLWSGTFDDQNSTAITIPSFTADGIAYTTMFVQANGWITLGGISISSSYSPISQSTSYPVVISAFGRDLNQAAAGTPKISYNTNDGGDIVVQYQDVRRYGVTGERLSFQIRLVPSTGNIKLVYGGTITGGTNTYYPQVGLRGATNTVFNNRTTTTNWAATIAGSSNTATCLMSTTVTPSVGLTYTFTPPVVGAPNPPTNPSPVNAAIDVPVNGSLTWTFGTNTFTYDLMFGPTGSMVQVVTGASAGGTGSYTYSSLNNNSIYQWQVIEHNGALTTNGPVWSFTTVCPAISAFPFTESFEGTVPPSCWSEVRTLSSSYGWGSYTTGYSGKCAKFDSYYNSSGNVSRLITPILDLSALSTAQLKFMFKNPFGGDFSVLLSTDGGATYPVTIWSGLTGQSAWVEKIANITAYKGNNVKIAFKGTSNYGDGDANIYLDDVTVEAIPACPVPSSQTVANITPSGADLGWTSPNSFFDIFIQTSSTPVPGPSATPTVNNCSGNSYTWKDGSLYTTYYWWVRTDCEAGGGAGQSDWTGPSSFYIGYCKPAPSSVDGLGITNVVFSSVSNPTGIEPNNYGDYSAMVGDVPQGTTIPVFITFSTGYTYDTKIWIDWNDDLDFSDAGEEVYTGTSLSDNPTILAASFAVPGDAPLGNHRMRIGGVDTGPPIPCYTGSYGSFEDYTVNVIALVPPVITSLGTTSGCVGGSLVINGTDLSGASEVTIGGTVAAITANTGLAITVTIGTGTTGKVQVTTPGGTTTSVDVFTVNQLPALFDVGGGGAYCPGTSGVSITLSGSESGVDYTLSTSPVTVLPGLGDALTFGPTAFDAGVYTISATNSTTGCTVQMTGTATVTVNPLPTAVTVTPPSASICPGSIQQLVASGGIVSGLTILSEDFNGGTNSWTTINNSTGGTPADAAWTLRPDAYEYKTYGTWHSNDNSQFYLSNSDAQGSGGITSTILQSPVFSTVGFTSADINFYHYFRYLGSNSLATVEASTNGTDWSTLQTYSSTQGGVAAFANASVALTAPFLNQATVYIRFKYDDSYGWYWGIDNVSITGAASAPITWLPVDGLYTDAGAGTPYAGGATATVYASPAASQTYTASATSVFGCTSSGEATVSLYTLPTAAFSSNSYFFCLGNPAELIVNFTGNGPWDFTWTDGITPVTTYGVPNPYTLIISPGPASNTTYSITGVTDVNGCSNTASSSARVLTGPVTTAENVFACPGTFIQIPIRVSSFENIGAISITLNYLTSVMTFDGFESATVLVGTVETPLIDYCEADESGSIGVIRFSGTPNPPAGLAEDAILITLNFNYIGGNTYFDFNDNPDTWCEYGAGPPDYTPYCDNPKTTYYINGSVTQYIVPEITDVTLQSNPVIAGPPWTVADGSFASGFAVCLDQVLYAGQFYYLDVNTLAVTSPLEDGFLNPFYLDSYTSATFAAWWTAKFDTWPPEYVTAMQSILTGAEPMFFIKLTGTDYQLIDGFSYLMGWGETILRVDSDYPEGTYNFLGTVKSAEGCTSADVPVSIQFHPVPQLTDVTLQFNPVTEGPPWTAADGSFASGFAICLDQVYYAGQFYYLDVNTLTVSVPLEDGYLNPFYLDSYTSATFTAWWTAKFATWPPDYVTAMQSILAGDEPMFFIKLTSTDYQLIDGFSYLMGWGETILRVDADYPEGTYNFLGTVKNEVGCNSVNVPVSIMFHAVPEPVITGPDQVCAGTEETYFTEGGMLGYEWSLTGGSGTSSTSSITVTWGDAGSGSVSVMYTDPDGNCTGISPTVKSITVNPNPVTTASVTSPIDCFGSTGTVTIDVPGIGIPVFTYYLEGQTPNISGVFPGIFAGTYEWYVTDGNGCISVTDEITLTQPDPIPVSGHFFYYTTSPAPMPLNNVGIELRQGGVTKYSGIYTDPDGYFLFGNVCAGSYQVVATKEEPVGSVNATDAAQVNYWGVHGSPPPGIEKVRFYAGDVAGSGGRPNNQITGTDAMRIQQYFVSGGTVPFDRLPWAFWTAGETILSNPLLPNYNYEYPTINVATATSLTFYGLVTGDFNRSFDPEGLKGGSANLALVYTDNRQVEANTEFELPVRAVSAMSVGAVSLILNFPSDLAEVTGISIIETGGSLDWAVNGDELRIGWNSQAPLNLSANEELLVISMKTTGKFVTGGLIRFTLATNLLNELADADFDVIPDAVLAVDVIEASTTGIEEVVAENLKLANYPNPFYGYTNINYSLPFEGEVTLEITSTLGTRVRTLVDATQPKGNYKVKFDTNELQPGVFMVTLRLRSNDDEQIRTIKIVRAW